MKNKIKIYSKAEDIIKNEIDSLLEQIKKVESNISFLEFEIEKSKEEIEQIYSSLQNNPLSSYELQNTMLYIQDKKKFIESKKKELKEEEKKLEELKYMLKEKMKEKKGVSVVKDSYKKKVIKNEKQKEQKRFDDFALRKKFITSMIILCLLALNVFAFDSIRNIEKKYENIISQKKQIADNMVKNLQKDKLNIEKQASILSIKKNYIKLLKKDLEEISKNVKTLFNYEEEGLKTSSKGKKQSKIQEEKLKKLYQIISQLPPEEGGAVLSETEPDLAAKLLMKIPSKKAADILAAMDPKKASKIIKLMSKLRTK